MSDIPMPEHIQVAAFRYAVVFDQAAMDRMRVEEKSDAYGFTDHLKLRIVVATDRAPDQQVDTLLHEVQHCVHYAVSVGHKDKLTAEELIGRANTVLLDTLRRNPGLVEYLCGRRFEAELPYARTGALLGADSAPSNGAVPRER